MADEYELKQVKVRLKLAEAEPLYSTEQITTPDKAAEVMAQALSQNQKAMNSMHWLWMKHID